VISEIKLLQLSCIIYDIEPFNHFYAWRGSVDSEEMWGRHCVQ
jgi:hypothetical protein